MSIIEKSKTQSLMGLNAKPEWLALAVFAVVAAGLRLLSPIDNFTPMAGLAVCCGIFAGNRLFASLLPLVVVAITDQFLGGFYGGMEYVYGSYIAIALLSGLTKRFAMLSTAPLFSLAASIVFFTISNFGVWAAGSGFFANPSFEGLPATYIAGIPFFEKSLFGDVLFTTLGFAAIQLALTRRLVLSKI